MHNLFVPARHSLPLLYSYRRCPFAMRARMALLQAGRRFDVVEIVLRDKPPSLLAASPKGTVPVLCLPEGPVLEESLDIMRWAFSANDPEGWWARAQSPSNLDLLQRNDGDFKRELDAFKYPERVPLERAAGPPARELAVEALLRPLEARLREQPQLGGDTPCATDLAIFPFVRQFAAVDPAWFAALPLPAVQAWLSAWLASALFAACMVKLPTGVGTAFPSFVS